MTPLPIDNLPTQKSLIDLSKHSEGDFGLDDYELSFIFEDIMLVEYVDETDTGELTRNGIYVPTNAITMAWRKGRVILKGPDVKYANIGDIVVFPNNLGTTVSNLHIADYGVIKKGIFLNEQRCFGICKEKNDSTITSTSFKTP